MEIPWQELDSETLDRLLSEIVTRDGTDYGLNETSTSAKIASAKKSLTRGLSLLLWDPDSETASLKTHDQAREEAAKFKALQKQSGISISDLNQDPGDDQVHSLNQQRDQDRDNHD